VNPFSWLYYRYIFLRENRVARTIAALVGSPAVPSREMWESQYKNGHWARLNDLSEQAHNAVVLSYITHLRPKSSVLEIGCGEGTLLRRLKQTGYRNYTGVDISDVAISRCQQFSDEKTIFLACDAESYVPETAFDIVVLNESIYYFVQPVVTMQRYANYLAPDGLFVISLFDKNRTRPIRRSLKTAFSLVDESVISNSKGTWYCLVLAPRRSSHPFRPVIAAR
jgi:SAM-dependent methyltransferase